AGVGLAAGAWALARRRGPFPARVLVAALWLVTLGIAYASSAALPDEHRVGNYVYGRYLACVAVAWLLLGVVALAKAGVRGLARVPGYVMAAAGLAGAAGGIAAWYAGDRLTRYHFIAFDFPEMSFLSGVRDRLDLVGASAVASGLLVCLALAAAAGRGRLLPVVGVLAAVNLAFAVHLAPASAPVQGRDRLPAPAPPGRVALDTRVAWGVWVPLTYRVWWTELERYPGGPPPAGACTAVVPDTAGPPPAGWTVTGSNHGWTTWSRAGCR
ncbi:hypothetical protein HII36_43850, partial [Nonomuraea sp. NN258]|nr:hypothetical protein [Nonomuraea antri]